MGLLVLCVVVVGLWADVLYVCLLEVVFCF